MLSKHHRAGDIFRIRIRRLLKGFPFPDKSSGVCRTEPLPEALNLDVAICIFVFYTS